MATATKAKTMTVFRSRGTHFKAVIRPSHRKSTDYGNEFVAGEYADFSPHGMYQTDEDRIIEYLRALPTFCIEFWEVGAEADAAESIEPIVEQIMLAATELDDAKLAQLEAEEISAHNRPDVLVVVRMARQNVQRLVDERENAPATAEGAGAPPAGGD